MYTISYQLNPACQSARTNHQYVTAHSEVASKSIVVLIKAKATVLSAMLHQIDI